MLEPFYREGQVEAGCDEAGRGCLAGPVFAAAVILPQGYRNPLLDDSKKLNHRSREDLRVSIEKEALSFGIGVVNEAEIDEINILNASLLAMHRALDRLSPSPGFILVDGNRFRPWEEIPHACIIKGDGIYMSIAAASILAKTHRDEYMEELHREYPVYGWDRNRGYPTREHRLAISRHGVCPYHRRSFRLTDQQLSLGFS